MKTVVIGDVHGCFKQLQNLFKKLDNAGCDRENDRFIFLGDYIDRGLKSKEVVAFVRGLQKNNENVIALKGNHEDMLQNFFDNDDNTWFFNSAGDTFDSYDDFRDVLRDDLNWIRSLPLYYEDEQNFYVHAGICPQLSLSEQNAHVLLWSRTEFLNSTEKCPKRVIFGHTPSVLYNGTKKPFVTVNGNLGLDTGCVYGGKLSALVICEDGREEILQ